MLTIPAELLTHTGTVHQVDRPVQGMVFSAYILTAEHGRFVLKLGASPALIAELQAEHRVLVGLRGAGGWVPEAVAHAVVGDTGYFLYTCVEGDNMLTALAAAPDDAARRHLAAEIGRALRRVHGWQPDFPRPTDWLGDELAALRVQAEAGVLQDPIDGRATFGGEDLKAVLAALEHWRTTVVGDTVWAHLDYCVPNTLVRDGRVAGVIDWSRGRYADGRIDLAAMVWSIRYNFKDEAYVDSFLAAYGYGEGAESLRPFQAIWVLRD